MSQARPPISSGAHAGAGLTEPNTSAPVGDDPFALHVEEMPPLALLCLVAALLAMSIQQVALPLLATSAYRGALERLDRAGDFSTNLAAIAGIVALGFGLHAFVRHSSALGLRRRLLLALLSGILLATMTIAVLFERHRMTTEAVRFALGASAVLASVLFVVAYRSVRGRALRALCLVAIAMAASVVAAQALEVATTVELAPASLRLLGIARGVGEGCYLVTLVGAGLSAIPARGARRAGLARSIAFFAMPVILGGLYAAELVLGSEYSLLLYHSQRVSLFVDELPRLYAIPLAVAATGGLAGLAAEGSGRRQAAAAALLLLGSGFAPHAPGRLLTFLLSLTLLARGVIARNSAAR